MQALKTMKPLPVVAAVAAVAAKPALRVDLAWPARAARPLLALGAAVVMSLWVGAAWQEPASTLEQEVQSFQQRVMAETATPSPAEAAAALAHRYLENLAPDRRLQISHQVRAEQRSGLTPEGNDAFVLRRLVLYEEALQAAGGMRAR